MVDKPSIRLFVAYANQDETFFKELISHLRAWANQQTLRITTTGSALPGDDYVQTIARHVKQVDAIVILLSADFMDSPWYWLLAVASKLDTAGLAKFIPVILRPIDLEMIPLDSLSILPENRSPVTMWGNRDEAMLDVALGIRDMLLGNTQRKNVKITEATTILGPSEQYAIEILVENESRQAIFLRKATISYLCFLEAFYAAGPEIREYFISLKSCKCIINGNVLEHGSLVGTIGQTNDPWKRTTNGFFMTESFPDRTRTRFAEITFPLYLKIDPSDIMIIRFIIDKEPNEYVKYVNLNPEKEARIAYEKEELAKRRFQMIFPESKANWVIYVSIENSGYSSCSRIVDEFNSHREGNHGTFKRSVFDKLTM